MNNLDMFTTPQTIENRLRDKLRGDMQKLTVCRIAVFGLVSVLVYAAAQISEVGSGLSDVEYFSELFGAALAIFAGVITNFAAKILLKNYSVRKFLMGRKHVEGHWELHTPGDGINKSVLFEPGVLFLEYDSDAQEVVVNTSRLAPDGTLAVTVSEVAHIRTSGPSVRYLNFFKVFEADQETKFGFSNGKFIAQHLCTQRPNRMEAMIHVEGNADSWRQYATRIPDSTVSKLCKRDGVGWIRNYLKELNSAASDANPSLANDKNTAFDQPRPGKG